MLHKIIQDTNRTVVSNKAGSNMSRGVITAVLAAMDWRGRLQVDVGLFEIDEGFAPLLAETLQPRVLAVLNLHRDQLDRYGELERTASLVGVAATDAHTVVLNADDARLRSLGDSLESVAWVAAAPIVQKQAPDDDTLYQSDRKKPHHVESLESRVFIASTRVYSSSQLADIVVEDTTYELQLALFGVFNVYNAAAALAVSLELDISPVDAIQSLAQVQPAFGRSELVQIGDKAVRILLVKNPSGFNHTIASYLTESGRPTLVAINDNYADGRDVSWLWDAQIENWNYSGDPVITSGVRAYDMALRLQYADITTEVEPDLQVAIERFITRLEPGETGYIVPTYTAMLETRKNLRQYADLEAWES